MLFKPKDEPDKYHGDCSYKRSERVTSYTEGAVPVEVMNLRVVHASHFIVCLRRRWPSIWPLRHFV